MLSVQCNNMYSITISRSYVVKHRVTRVKWGTAVVCLVPINHHSFKRKSDRISTKYTHKENQNHLACYAHQNQPLHINERPVTGNICLNSCVRPDPCNSHCICIRLKTDITRSHSAAIMAVTLIVYRFSEKKQLNNNFLFFKKKIIKGYFYKAG